MQDRQRECGSLARSGLGDADHIAARHDSRDRTHLDRGWNEVFFFREDSCDGVVKSEIVKGGQRESLSFIHVIAAAARCAEPALRVE